MVNNTDVFVTALDPATGRLLGFARVLTDFSYVALIVDVIVRPEWRARGIGSALMEAIVEDPRLAQVQSLELVCQEALEPFYSRWGFTSRVGGSRLMRRTAGIA
jgi:predicted GNAT family N-acyltransferase